MINLVTFYADNSNCHALQFSSSHNIRWLNYLSKAWVAIVRVDESITESDHYFYQWPITDHHSINDQSMITIFYQRPITDPYDHYCLLMTNHCTSFLPVTNHWSLFFTNDQSLFLVMSTSNKSELLAVCIHFPSIPLFHVYFPATLYHLFFLSVSLVEIIVLCKYVNGRLDYFVNM